jgi:GTPase SAR1 family protein
MNHRPRFQESEIAARLKAISQVFVDHAELASIRSALRNQMRYGISGRSAKLMLFLAEAGCGKSTLIRDFIAQEQGRTPPDLLYVSLPVPCTIKGMTSEMLRRLGDPLCDRSTTATRNSFRIVHQLQHQNKRLIIIDEFQHLIDHDRDRVLRLATDWLKTLLDEAGVPVVCVGLPNSIEIIRSNKQLERRTTKVTRLHPFEWREGSQGLEFR